MMEHDVEQSSAQACSLVVGTDAYASQVSQSRHDFAGTVIGSADKTQSHADHLTVMVCYEQESVAGLRPHSEPLSVRGQTPRGIRERPDLDCRLELAGSCGPNNCHGATISNGPDVDGRDDKLV
jgi:hypothetical protein